MKPDLILLILGMAAATYVSRAVPAIWIGKNRFGPRMNKFLRLIPYTAMSALVFPGVFFVDASRPEIGIVGGAVAALLAWKKLPVMVCVLAAVLVDLLLYWVA